MHSGSMPKHTHCNDWSLVLEVWTVWTSKHGTANITNIFGDIRNINENIIVAGTKIFLGASWVSRRTCNLTKVAVQLSTQTSSSTLTTTTSELSLFGLSFEHLAKPNTELAMRRRWSQFNLPPPVPVPSLAAMFAHKNVLISPVLGFLLGAGCASSQVCSPRRVEEYWRGLGAIEHHRHLRHTPGLGECATLGAPQR